MMVFSNSRAGWSLALLLTAASSMARDADDAAGAAGPGTSPATPALSLTLDEMRTLSDVLGHVQRDYVDETSDRDLLERAIRGMVSDLDAHTAYLDREEYARLEADTRGRYGGIGIEVVWQDQDLLIAKVNPTGPAGRAGVHEGDYLTAVEGIAVSSRQPRKSIEKVRGRPGTEVRITIRRGESDEILSLTLVREVIRVASVSAELYGDGLGYLRIDTFQTDTADAAALEMARLSDAAGGSLGGLVLDMRGNPGGVLTAAVALSDMFLEEGLIVTTRGRREGSQTRYEAGPDDEIGGAPIVVIVDESSASASEIVAGALQDHGRALVLGEKTFGKGSVQSVLPLRNGGAIKLTTSRYYTPSGRSIHEQGIQPDITIAGMGRRSGDAENPEALTPSAKTFDPPRDEFYVLADEDYPLYRALIALRAERLLDNR
ncbi:MAG: S41 family peptidase [Xanthomonadales bacterium]|nr:S41 family peptidase [Xanthomonadales bacterium]